MSKPAAKKPTAPTGFAAQLIAALEDAQEAASQPKPPAQLAQAAWNKLQFDFPIVSQEELAALVQEYASGARTDVSSRFLAVLRESAASAAPTAGSSSSTEPSTAASADEDSSKQALMALYQQLYALAVVQSLQHCLDAPEAAALAQLVALRPSPSAASGPVLHASGNSQLEEVLAAAAAAMDGAPQPQIELEHRMAQQEDDDSTAYEPLEPYQPVPQQAEPARQQPGSAAAAAATAGDGSDEAGAAVTLGQELAELAGHLSYHCMSDSATWRELALMQRLAACLAAARRHARFLELHGAGAVQPLLRLAADRMLAHPVELEAGLAALLNALGIPGSSGSSSSSGRPAATEPPAVAAAAAELALALAVALAAQATAPSARRRLWHEVHQRLLPVAAQQLEQQQMLLARQARAAGTAAGAAAQPSPQQQYSIQLPCQLLYFYMLQAPASESSWVQDALVKNGTLRSLVLLFVQLGQQAGAEPLRCVLLLACASAQQLADWAAAVPGFTAATTAPALQPGGEAQLHGALWRVLLSGSGHELAALLADATPADKVPGVYQALQLMADCQAVSRQPQQLWGSEVDAALRDLAGTLRQQYSKPQQQPEAAAGSSEAAGEASGARMERDQGNSHFDGGNQQEDATEEDEEDAKKLGVAAEEQAGRLAARRAQQLQPACLKLIKDLLQRQAGGGKHD